MIMQIQLTFHCLSPAMYQVCSGEVTGCGGGHITGNRLRRVIESQGARMKEREGGREGREERETWGGDIGRDLGDHQ